MSYKDLLSEFNTLLSKKKRTPSEETQIKQLKSQLDSIHQVIPPLVPPNAPLAGLGGGKKRKTNKKRKTSKRLRKTKQYRRRK